MRIPMYHTFYPYTWRAALWTRQRIARVQLWWLERNDVKED